MKHLKAVCFIFIFTALVHLSCTRETTDSENITSNQNYAQLDSLIEIGVNKNLSTEIRHQSLLTAYQVVIGDNLSGKKAHYFNKIADSFLEIGDTLRFTELNTQARNEAFRIKDTIALANSHWDLGYYYDNYSIADKAYDHYAEAERYFGMIGEPLKQAKVLRNMARVQSNVKDYVGCENNILKAISLLKPLGEREQLYRSYNSLGIAAMNLEDYDQALEYHAEALEYLKGMDDNDRWLPLTLNNLGMVYYEMGEYEKARVNFEKVILNPNVKKNFLGTFARALNNIGLCRLKLEGKFMDPDVFFHAIDIKDSIGDLAGLAKAYYSLSEFHLVRGDSIEALNSAIKAKDYAIKSNNNDRLLASLELLTQLDKKNATLHSEAYINLNDSLILAERQIRNKFGRIEFRTNEFIAQNELLERQRTLLLGIVIGLMLLAIAILIIVQQGMRNQKLRAKQQQQAANQEIFDLMLSQNQKKEEGKKLAQKRISQELHDGILGQLNGIRMLLLGLNKKADDSAVEMRSNAIGMLQDVQEEIRTLSHELNDSALQKVNNFIDSLYILLENTAVTAGLSYQFDYSKDYDWDAINSDYKINLYRITQETMQNSIKHARASTIKLTLEFIPEENLINLLIADDGEGFDISHEKKGIGLKNIASRVKDLGGKWKIKSKIGKGTTVSIFLPDKSPLQPMDQPSKGILQKA